MCIYYSRQLLGGLARTSRPWQTPVNEASAATGDTADLSQPLLLIALQSHTESQAAAIMEKLFAAAATQLSAEGMSCPCWKV
jgi:hypothetical protein